MVSNYFGRVCEVKMNKKAKESRCAFVIIKLKISGEDWLIMRRNPSWKDINFIGGHENDRDNRNRQRTAKRELLEEIPVLKGFRSHKLEKLTGEIAYGPILSRSASCEVKYDLQFFLLRFSRAPKPVLESLHGRTLNIMLRENDLLVQRKYKISALVRLLDRTLPGGLKSIPYSWSADLREVISASDLLLEKQTEFAFDCHSAPKPIDNLQ